MSRKQFFVSTANRAQESRRSLSELLRRIAPDADESHPVLSLVLLSHKIIELEEKWFRTPKPARPRLPAGAWRETEEEHGQGLVRGRLGNELDRLLDEAWQVDLYGLVSLAELRTMLREFKDAHGVLLSWEPRFETRHSIPEPAKPVEAAVPALPSSKIARAIACLMDHPEWTNDRIAKEAGCNSKYLSQNKRFKAAKTAMRKVAREQIPRGSKDKSGHLEAWDGDDD